MLVRRRSENRKKKRRRVHAAHIRSELANASNCASRQERQSDLEAIGQRRTCLVPLSLVFFHHPLESFGKIARVFLRDDCMWYGHLAENLERIRIAALKVG